MDTKYIVERGASLDTLECVPEHGCTTLLQELRRQVSKIPNSEFLGTRVGDTYEWMTWRDATDFAEHLSYGLVHHNLVPTVNAEGTEWKFIGIQAKNRKEWNLSLLASMHQNITAVSLYDTLGVDATMYILNQTELTTMVVGNEYLLKLADMKIADSKSDSPKAARLVNLIAMDNNVTDE